MLSTRFLTGRMVFRIWPLLVLLGLILFPFGWLGDLWPRFGLKLGRVFPDAQAHAVGHASLFFLLGTALLLVAPRLRSQPWRYLGLLLLVGIGQELFQLAYKQRRLVYDDFRDLVTDLCGGLVALALVMLIQRWRTRSGR